MHKVVMDETIGLFCVDILVTLAIFPTKAVPRYALYNDEKFVQICSDFGWPPRKYRIWLVRLKAFCKYGGVYCANMEVCMCIYVDYIFDHCSLGIILV